MASSLRAAATRVDGTGLSLTPSYPAGIQAGDLILLHAYYHNGTTTTTGTWGTPTGFTLVRKQDVLVSAAKKGELAVFARRAVGNESGTVTVTRTGNSGTATVSTANMTAWQMVAGTTDTDGYEAVTGVSDETPPYDMTVTTLGVDRAVVAWIFANDNVAATGTSTGWSNVIAPYTDTTGPDYAGHVATIVKATAGGQAGQWSQSAGIEGALIGLALIAPTGSAVALAGGATGASTTSGAMGLRHRLEGAATGQSTTSGAVRVRVRFTGTATGAAVGSGDVMVERGLVGSAPGTSTTSGAMQARVGLAGSATGTGATSGDMRVYGIRPLAGEATGAGATSGALVVERGLTGAATGVTTTSGQMEAGVALGGTATGVGATTGTMRSRVRLTASAAGAATTVGDLTVSSVGGNVVPVAGTATGASSTSGAPTVRVRLAGAAAGVAGAAGSLQALLQLSASAQGSGATGAAALRARTGLVGTSAGASTAAAVLTAIGDAPPPADATIRGGSGITVRTGEQVIWRT